MTGRRRSIVRRKKKWKVSYMFLRSTKVLRVSAIELAHAAASFLQLGCLLIDLTRVVPSGGTVGCSLVVYIVLRV